MAALAVMLWAPNGLRAAPWVDAYGSTSHRVGSAWKSNGDWHVFERRSSGAFFHAYGATSLSAWSSLGGNFAGPPRPIAGQSERMYVFGRTAGGTIWNKFESIPEDAASFNAYWRPIAYGIESQASVIRRSDGRLQLFGRTPSGTAGFVLQTNPADPYSTWSTWNDLGGNLVGEVTAIENDDGRVEAFARTANGTLWHKWMWSASNDTSWSSWYSLGGNITTHAVGKNADGRLEVFALTAGGMLWHKWQLTPGATTSWSSWHLIGGDVTGTGSASQGDLAGWLRVASDSEGRLAVLVADDAERGWLVWQKAPNGQLWSYWTSICETASVGFEALDQHPARDGIGLVATMRAPERDFGRAAMRIVAEKSRK